MIERDNNAYLTNSKIHESQSENLITIPRVTWSEAKQRQLGQQDRLSKNDVIKLLFRAVTATMNNTSTTATNSIATETKANIIATTEPNCTATRTTAAYYCNNSNIYSTGTVTMDTFMYTKGAATSKTNEYSSNKRHNYKH